MSKFDHVRVIMSTSIMSKFDHVKVIMSKPVMSESSCLSRSCLSESCLGRSCQTHFMPIVSPWQVPHTCRFLSAMSRRSFTQVLRVIPFCQYFREKVIIYFLSLYRILRSYNSVSTLCLYILNSYMMLLNSYMMLLKVKGQFNGCLCMQARLKYRVLFNDVPKD